MVLSPSLRSVPQAELLGITPPGRAASTTISRLVQHGLNALITPLNPLDTRAENEQLYLPCIACCTSRLRLTAHVLREM